MTPGNFRHRVRIEKLVRTQNAYGEEADSWEVFAVANAFVEPMRADTLFEADQRQMAVTHKITMRYTSGLKGDYRVFYKSRYYRIDGVVNIEERGRFTELLCTELEDRS